MKRSTLRCDWCGKRGLHMSHWASKVLLQAIEAASPATDDGSAIGPVRRREIEPLLTTATDALERPPFWSRQKPAEATNDEAALAYWVEVTRAGENRRHHGFRHWWDSCGGVLDDAAKDKLR